jgi:hypothetical protein
VLKLLAFLLGDKRDFGQKEIKLALRHSRYSRGEARLVIANALQGRPREVLTTADEALAQGEKRNAKTELESNLGSFSEMPKALK